MEKLLAEWVELLGMATGLAYVFFAIREKTILWLFWILSSAAYFFVFLESKFYAAMILQVYYLAAGAYGWYSWSSIDQRPISALSGTGRLWLGITAGFLGMAVSGLLAAFSDSPQPYADGFGFSLSILASILLAKKKIENWGLWILVNFLYLGLFLYSGLWFTAVLYLVFLGMAIAGWRTWSRKIGDNQDSGKKEEENFCGDECSCGDYP